MCCLGKTPTLRNVPCWTPSSRRCGSATCGWRIATSACNGSCWRSPHAVASSLFGNTRSSAGMPVPACVARGTVYEQQIWFTDDAGDVHSLRRVVLKLDEPTREGEAEIVLLTNLPAEVSAPTVAEVYRKRWTIEGAFYELTETLACEVDTLC